MSKRYNNGSHYENHQRAAEIHESAAHAHRTAADSHDKQDHETGQEHSRQALEQSRQACEHTRKVHRDVETQHGIAAFGHREISELAYSLWQVRGSPQGSPEVDWFHAAHQLRIRSSSLPLLNGS